MRAENELYRYCKKTSSGTRWEYTRVEAGKDVFGYKIERGAYVIWQKYSSGDGMHIGQVIDVQIVTKDYDRITIQTADNKKITRRGYEVVLLAQQRFRFEGTADE